MSGVKVGVNDGRGYEVGVRRPVASSGVGLVGVGIGTGIGVGTIATAHDPADLYRFSVSAPQTPTRLTTVSYTHLTLPTSDLV